MQDQRNGGLNHTCAIILGKDSCLSLLCSPEKYIGPCTYHTKVPYHFRHRKLHNTFCRCRDHRPQRSKHFELTKIGSQLLLEGFFSSSTPNRRSNSRSFLEFRLIAGRRHQGLRDAKSESAQHIHLLLLQVNPNPDTCR